MGGALDHLGNWKVCQIFSRNIPNSLRSLLQFRGQRINFFCALSRYSRAVNWGQRLTREILPRFFSVHVTGEDWLVSSGVTFSTKIVGLFWSDKGTSVSRTESRLEVPNLAVTAFLFNLRLPDVKLELIKSVTWKWAEHTLLFANCLGVNSNNSSASTRAVHSSWLKEI